jgi:hypothetical protein
VIALAIAAGCAPVTVTQRDPLSDLKSKTGQFTTPEAAVAAGYGLVPDLDHCFDNPGVGAMGFHYINTAALDVSVDPLAPEAIVYAPRVDGQLELAAVEYIVPAANWDGEGNTKPPTAHGQTFHLNKDLGVYVLHAWLFKENPKGIFEDWNPTVSCPE